jgi:hypothetical protein
MWGKGANGKGGMYGDKSGGVRGKSERSGLRAKQIGREHYYDREGGEKGMKNARIFVISCICCRRK